MFTMVSADRTTSELLFFITLTSPLPRFVFSGARLEVRSLVVCSKCFPKQQRNFPSFQNIFVSVATVIQDIYISIGIPEK